MRPVLLPATRVLSLGALLLAIGCSKEAIAPSNIGPISLSVVSGDGQSGVAGTQLAQPLIVKVTVNGLPRPLQVLNFRVVLGNGNVFGGTELTDLRGIAQELWTLGTKAGDPQKVEVRAVDPATGAPQVFATFTATARPGAATTLAVSGLQSPLTAGVSSPITVTAKDAFGNTATGYGGTVHFSSTDPLAVLPPNHAFVATDVGSYTATAILKTPGIQTVTTTDVVTSSITGGQTVTVTARTAFNVASAASTGNTSMTVTFDAPPNTAQATNLGNYSVPGLTLSGTATLSGNTVTLTTSSQAATSYTVTVTGVTRASDGEPLTTASATFTARTTFNVASAASTGNTSMTVTFDGPPNIQALTIGNYNVPGLNLSGTVTLIGNTVTLTTSSQAATPYTVTVTGVARVNDGEPLTVASASFTGTPP